MSADQTRIRDSLNSKSDGELFAIVRGSSQDFTELAQQIARQILEERGHDVGRLISAADEAEAEKQGRLEKRRARAVGFAEAGRARGVCLSCGAVSPSETQMLFARRLLGPDNEGLPDLLEVAIPLCGVCAPNHRIPGIPGWAAPTIMLALALPLAFAGAWVLSRIAPGSDPRLPKIGALVGLLAAMLLGLVPYLLRRPRIDRVARLHPMIVELKDLGFTIVAEK